MDFLMGMFLSFFRFMPTALYNIPFFL